MTYGLDYKLNTIHLYFNRNNHNRKIKEILEIQNIVRSTLYYWIKNKDTIMEFTKNKIKTKIKRISKISDECKNYIINYVLQYKQFQIKKLIKSISKKFKVKLTKQSIYNVLKDNKISKKRVKVNHYPHSKSKLEQTKQSVNTSLEKEEYNVISQDESALYLYTNNNYGWSKVGTECEINGKNKANMQKFSLAMDISRNKVVGYTLRKGAFNGATFNSFMMGKIKRNNKENKKYILDNAKIHHAKLLSKEVKEKCIYNIPYYSKSNPIEMYFNSLKKYLNTIYIKSMSSLRRHLNIFIERTTSKELNNYFDKAFSFLKD
jgi:transposase